MSTPEVATADAPVKKKKGRPAGSTNGSGTRRPSKGEVRMTFRPPTGDDAGHLKIVAVAGTDGAFPEISDNESDQIARLLLAGGEAGRLVKSVITNGVQYRPNAAVQQIV